MRNEPKPLDRDAAMRAYALRDRLNDIRQEGSVVTLQYFKRDGSPSQTTGTVAGFSGRDGCDTMSVTLKSPTKGHRTINLAGVVRAFQ